jgi:flavin reductase (DIM6/NTAB) family NADH-FMN oxidoreductase RutF
VGERAVLAPELLDVAIGERPLRDALARFVTGVAVVTVRDALGHPRVFTATSFTSVSLEHRLVSVCVADSARTSAALLESSTFAISILAAHQQGVAERFASRAEDKFVGLELEEPIPGAVLLADSTSALACEVHARVPLGDHALVVGHVREWRVGPCATALTYGNRRFGVAGVSNPTLARFDFRSTEGVSRHPKGCP